MDMKIYRVTTLPAEPEAGALYLYRNITSGQLEIHVVSEDGLSVVRALTSADVISAIDSAIPDSADKLTNARSITATGDASWTVSFDGSEDVSADITLAASGVTAGEYSNFTVDDKGRVTAARAITGADIGRGEYGGVAPLGEDGLVPAEFLPSYVDDVIEVEAYDQLPGKANDPGTNGVPSKGKIYVVVEEGVASIYRWSGVTYFNIPSGVGVADSALKLATARSITATGDASWTVSFDGTENVSAAITLAESGVTAGEYPVVTVNAKGLVTGGRALTEEDIPTLTWETVESAASLYVGSPEW